MCVCVRVCRGVAVAYTDQRPYAFHETEPDASDSDALLLSRSYFDCQEYRRAAYVLGDAFGHALGTTEVTVDARTPNLAAVSSNKTLFVGCYALYLVRPPCAVLT